jgi:hypothetical protein
MDCSPIPELPGGSIALVDIDDNKVQEPPTSLRRIHASREKQVAFNKRVFKNEEEITAINSGLADFAMGTTMEKASVVCVNVGNRIRGSRAVCGELWTQEDKQMSAASTSLTGMGNSREEVCLSGIADALSWRHTLETNDYEPHSPMSGRAANCCLPEVLVETPPCPGDRKK